MPTEDLLHQAIAAARAGHELTARELFLQVVEQQPYSEVAWMWLTGLLDDIEERVYACNRVLEINPGNGRARQYLIGLMPEYQKVVGAKKTEVEREVEAARGLIQQKKPAEALALLRSLDKELIPGPEAWQMLAQLSPDIDEQVHALQQVLAFTPQDTHAQQELKRRQHFQQNPLDLAAMYEEQGAFDKAMAVYRGAALKDTSERQWNAIYRKITHLENLQSEQIVHIPPAISIARLTFGPALLYFSSLMLQVGLSPFAEPQPFLWIGFLWVLLGGFFVALASVRSRHRLWLLLFKDAGQGGSPASRFMLALAGWLLILFPHILLVVDSFQRLAHTVISFP